LSTLVLAAGCTPEPEETTPTTGTTETETENLFPLPPDIDEIDWESVFADAIRAMLTVKTQSAWQGHAASLDLRQPGCPDFWTGQFTDNNVLVGSADGISWFDACETEGGLQYDGWITWDSSVLEYGDPTTSDGRTTEATRSLEGKALVATADGPRFEFNGDANDNLYVVEAYGYNRFTYSSTVDGTVTGSDVFAPDSVTPEGYRTDLYQFISGGDVDLYEARGNVYMFTPQLQGRFDSIAVDISILGPLGAGPDDCTLEPLGWIGVRDQNAYWYDVVFLPRTQEDIVGDRYPNDPLSVCDGKGRLYIQGIEQEGRDVEVDFSFLFEEDFGLPTAEDYILPLHSL
jgi:hypothetical protein